MNFEGPRPLQPGDDVAGFSSGKRALDEWLSERAAKSEHGKTARTYVVVDTQPGAVAGYYCLSAHSVAQAEIGGGRLGRNAPNPVPVILLGRLAIDQRYQGEGLGAALLKDALQRTISAAQVVGARALIVHTIDDDVAGFYLRYGFRAMPANPRTLYLPLDALVNQAG
ncbi:GNAT family N-acetyltransferase [Gryllotalpicola reticulitermitis]|uniref:GNAT family N-acetyltransferase n=1 Tax=Gryllotalpicola reticulitermitis TaxID=1184153 RepID=A0ABV8Q7U1_9MICO